MNKEQERNRLIELLEYYETHPHDYCKSDCYSECKYLTKENSCNIYARVADHLLNSGVIVPPVKVGDKVYQIDLTDSIYESEVLQIFFNTKGIAFDERAIGKTVFLTKEEAEKALKELT